MTKEVTKKKFITPLLAAVFLCALFVRNAELAVSYVRQGIESCFLTVIPSLFPLMVVAEILNECGVLSFIGKLFGSSANRLFGISQGSASAVALGLLLGFPMGTKALIVLYDRGEISADELEYTLGFCGIPSFAFIVNAVGISLFHSRSLGVAFYFFAIFSALLAGIVFAKRKTKKSIGTIPTAFGNKKSSAEIVTGAIASATSSVILLCAYVIFFSAVVGCLSNLFELSSLGGAVIGVILELSTGAVSSAAVGGLCGVALCGFVIGWSGLSVHFQTAALVGDRVQRYSRYFAIKLFQGLMCAALALLFAAITDVSLPEPPANVPTFAPIFAPEYTAITLVMFFVCALGSTKRSAAKRYGIN